MKLYPYFIVFADENKEEIATALVITGCKEAAENIARKVVEEEEMGDCKCIVAQPFTMDFINEIGEAGVVLLNYADEYVGDEREFFNGEDNNGGKFFN